MSKKSNWTNKTIAIKNLHLDLDNPRVPKHVKDHKDANQMRNYLLKKEGVYKIAASIALSGYHHSAVSIVCEENGKLVVLDGNRRLAACQLLMNPHLAPDAREKTRFDELKAKMDTSQIREIPAVIAPSRQDAEKEIWDIHVTQLLKPWETLQKLRMYSNLITSGNYDVNTASKEYGVSASKFKKELSKFAFYERILKNIREEDEPELLNSGFNKIERILLSSNGKKILKYETNKNGEIVPEDKEHFDTTLEKLIPYIVDPSKVNAQATQSEIKEAVYSKVDPVMFKPKTAVNPSTTKKAPPNNSPTAPSPKTSKKTKITDWVRREEWETYQGAERVKRMLKEMALATPKNQENILLTSIRVVLEMALYHKLEASGHIEKMTNDKKAKLKAENKKRATGKSPKPARTMPKNWCPTFKEMLKYCTDATNGAIKDPQARKALQKMIGGEEDFVNDLNNFIHNVRITPKKGTSEALWASFGRFLLQQINKIA